MAGLLIPKFLIILIILIVMSSLQTITDSPEKTTLLYSCQRVLSLASKVPQILGSRVPIARLPVNA